MPQLNTPDAQALPTTAQLLKSTAIAAATALIILVTIVMPAEYAIDPTGIGRLTGLQKMGEIKMSLAQEAEADRLALETAEAPTPTVLTPAIEPAAPEQVSGVLRQDTTTITLAPDDGHEVKVDLKKGEVVRYSWKSDAGKANFDIHADSKPLKISYHGYGKGSATEDTGEIVAAFDGSHGWFWRNRSGAPLTITLETEGPYTAIKQFE